jgi:hypothetical protein
VAAGVAGAALAGGGGSVAQPARQAAVSNNVDSEFCIFIAHLLEWMNQLNDFEIEEISLASAHACFYC